MEPRYRITRTDTDLPVTLQELKNNVRVTSSSLDNILLQHLRGAVGEAESYTGRLFMPATVTAYLDSYPATNNLEINKGPVVSITSIKYYKDGDSELTTVDPANYQLDNIEIDARIRFDETFTPDPDRLNAIEIVYVAGWAAADQVPRQVKDAIILIASERYLNPLMAGISSQARSLLDSYKNKRF